MLDNFLPDVEKTGNIVPQKTSENTMDAMHKSTKMSHRKWKRNDIHTQNQKET